MSMPNSTGQQSLGSSNADSNPSAHEPNGVSALEQTMSNRIKDEKVELTPEWLDFLQSLANAPSRNGDGERAAKRLKPGYDSPSIPIFQDSLEIICRLNSHSSIQLDTPLTISDVVGSIGLIWNAKSVFSHPSISIVPPDDTVPIITVGNGVIVELSDELSFILRLAWHKGHAVAGAGAFSWGEKSPLIKHCSGCESGDVVASDTDQFKVTADLKLSRLDNDLVKMCFNFGLGWYENTAVSSKIPTAPSISIREELLQMISPDGNLREYAGQCSPQDFYRSAFVTDDKDKQTLRIDGLAAIPYPFQQRAIRWLLRREGVQWVDDNGNGNYGTLPITERTATPMESHTYTLKDFNSQRFYVNTLFGTISRDSSTMDRMETNVRGGILAEEMGLGKTVEIIALILLHRRPDSPAIVKDPYLGAVVRTTSATLIVTPPALLHQWASELQQHAPHLNVMVYKGIGKSCKDPEAEASIVAELALHDVVLTTYATLRTEIHFAVEPPQRSMRGARKYHRPKSPLIQLSWWRICMDEAQEVDSGVSSAATLARILPRINAWAVTGTPVKDDIKDLWGLLMFLRYDPYASYPKVWGELIKHERDVFRALFNTIALRHSKRNIRTELELPPQKRFVLTVPLSAVEERWYSSMLVELAGWCGLTPQGEPMLPTWYPDDSTVIERMKTALDRLRKTALHPTVIPGGPMVLGRTSGGPMRTVAEVLDAMIESSASTATLSKRAALSNKLTQGQFFENSPRVKEALAIWEAALKESDDLVSKSRERLLVLAASSSEGEASDAKSPTESDDAVDFDAVSAQISDAQRSLRYALEIQHRAVFLCASAHFQIKSNPEMTEADSEEFRRLEGLETGGYDRAKLIRSEILQESRGKAMRVMEKISKRPSSKESHLFSEHKSRHPGGITLTQITEKMNSLGTCLNKQAHFLNTWRKQAIELVLMELVDQGDDDVTGEEFADSTKVQEDLMVYITVLRVAVQDRRAALVGHASTYVAEDEVRRATQQAEADIGPSPAKMLEMLAQRRVIRPDRELSCVQVVVTELRDIGLRLKREAGWRGGPQEAGPEELIVQAETKRIQQFLDAQLKALATMNQDVLDLTSAMNTRIEFYRQLQAISDTVAPYGGNTDDAALATIRQEGDKLTKKSATAESQHRYLMTLKANDQGEESHMCIICQELFSVGVLTVCGHAYCKDCLNEWFKQKRSCPQCKKALQRADLHDITLKPQELGFHLEDGNQAASGEWKKDQEESSIYSKFNDQLLADIRNIALPGFTLTAKPAMIVKHLIWLRTADPGAKTIIFSQYPSFLEALSHAFTTHGIHFTTFTDRDGITKFKERPDIECFLLHARAHSSGLNLVNASHVILCEPLLNTALELQAIARVHRIGQRRATTVWLYIVEGTVEESVYTLSVRRRMKHMEGVRRNAQDSFGDSMGSMADMQAESLEISNSEEIENAKFGSLMTRKRRGQDWGGEAIPNEDLYECLFGKPRSAIGRHPLNQENEAGTGLNGIRDVPLVRRHLLGEAAEQRVDNGEGSSRGNGLGGS